MVRHLDAIFEDGVLRPLEPLPLSAHQRVRLTVDDAPRGNGGAPKEPNHRIEEMRWLEAEGANYAGEWVALDGSQLVAHGPDSASVYAAAQAAGVERPLLTHIPEESGLPFGGW